MPARKGKDSIEAGISKMKDYNLVISPESKNLTMEFDNYSWESDKKSDGNFKRRPNDNYNHAIDAIRYAMEQLAQTASFYFK